jgi:hypothetical protein
MSFAWTHRVPAKLRDTKTYFIRIDRLLLVVEIAVLVSRLQGFAVSLVDKR